MLLVLSLISFLALLAARADGKKDAPLQVHHRQVGDPESPFYKSDVMIPHGKKFQITCPRPEPFDKPDGRNMTNTKVSFLGGIYSINFNNITFGTEACPDDFVGEALQGVCDDQQRESTYCTVTANDPSKKKGCSKRPLRVRFVCVNPGDRAVLVSIIVDE